MTQDEYIDELRILYRMAIDQRDVAIALDILERGRELNINVATASCSVSSDVDFKKDT